MHKILVTDPAYFPESARAIMREVGDVVAKQCTREELLNEIADADAVALRVTTRIDDTVLSSAKKLKIIGSATTGTDHIDCASCEARGIPVVSLSGANTVSTAEFTFAALLSLVKKIPWAHQSLGAGAWKRESFFGAELSGKTLGVVGFGRIGRMVGMMGCAFGMRVVWSDPYVEADAEKDQGTEKTTFEELLRRADIITVHSFLSDETKSMIGYDELKRMKPGGYVINCARGNIVHEEGLIRSLEEGHAAGAALDVFSEEPLLAANPLMQYAATHDNLLLTPHIAGSSVEAIEKASKFIAEKIKEKLLTL